MKNFLSIDNLNIPSGESLKEVVQSSSEMEGCPITNILESEDKSIWLSTEELPQEITINLSKSLFKEYPEKISAIGIYCWHAYPTNPKLIEIQISKNKGESYISLGNFDLCLKPGRQLLQLEDDSEYILTNDISEKLILKLIIKETFGDKRTYINNIYLYDDINLAGKQLLSNMETIKEEDSNSLIYLRESRERTMPKSNLKEKANNTNDKNNNQNNLLEFNLDIKSEEEKNKNISKVKKDENIENENKIIGFESEFMMSDSELSEKYTNFNLDSNKEDNLFKIEMNNKKENILNTNKENNNVKKEEIININEQSDKKEVESKKNNIKNDDKYFIEKMPNEQFSKITSEREEPHDINEKEKSLNVNDFNDDENIENEKDINHSINNESFNKNNNNYDLNEYDGQSNNSFKEEDLNTLINEFENYKKIQNQKVKNYEKKLKYLENQFKEMTLLSNKMNNTISAILESQMNQKKINHDNLLSNMRKIINERITRVFYNYNNFLNPITPIPLYSVDSMGNEYKINIPVNRSININKYNNIRKSNYEGINNKNKSLIKIKSEKKYLKLKNNSFSERNKSGQKMAFRINNNDYSNIEKPKNYFIMNNEENESFSNENIINNIYNNDECNNENDFKNYPLQMGIYSEENIQHFPFYKKTQIKRGSNYNNFNRSNNNFTVMNNINRNSSYRLNTDNNEVLMNNKTQKIFSNQKYFPKKLLSNNNRGSFQVQNKSINNELEQAFTEFRNNLGEKISEQILKPSISKIENYMKGNIREVKKAFLSKDKKNNKNIKNKINNKEKNDISSIKKKNVNNLKANKKNIK